MRAIIRANTKFHRFCKRFSRKGKGMFFWRKSFSKNYEIRLAPFTKINRPIWIPRSCSLNARVIWPASVIPRRER